MNQRGFELRSVSKLSDGRMAVSDLSLAVPAGEHTALLGPSGCGKTTLIRLLAGLDAPSAGQVLLNGEPVSEPGKILLPPHRRGVAMVFQDLALWPNLCVRDNVLLGLSGSGLAKQEALMRSSEALALCGVAPLAARRPGKISGGEQQRVALARAVATRPGFLFLDEPFSSLDLATKTTLLTDVGRLAAEQQFTIVLVTHDLFDATTLCRDAIVLNQGRVQEAGTLSALLADPRSEILRIFRDRHLQVVAY